MLATAGHPPITSGPIGIGSIAASVAFGLSLLPFGAGLAHDGWQLLAVGGFLGLGIGSVLAYRESDAARTRSAAAIFGAALVLAVKAVLVGDLLVSVAISVFGSTSGSGEAVLAIPLLAVFGLAIFGLPAFGLAFLLFWPWGFIVRSLLRTNREAADR